MGIKTFFASNVCCAYDREKFWFQGGFIQKTIFNEDMIFAGKAVLQDDYAIAYVAPYRDISVSSQEAGVPRIRIHDIRHSAVSLLIDMGFSATAIADRVGHESVNITYNYAHLFPSKQTEMADKLNMERGN